MKSGIWVLGLLLAALPAVASVGEVQNLGAHRTSGGMEEFQRVIDSKCTICHTRERIDLARSQGSDLEKIERQMIERGAILSEHDKSVLGTFWGSPLKKKP